VSSAVPQQCTGYAKANARRISQFARESFSA
jgi:hypothetical protein